jgi:hypothetical protein
LCGGNISLVPIDFAFRAQQVVVVVVFLGGEFERGVALRVEILIVFCKYRAVLSGEHFVGFGFGCGGFVFGGVGFIIVVRGGWEVEMLLLFELFAEFDVWDGRKTKGFGELLLRQFFDVEDLFIFL